MSKVTELASGQITNTETITVKLIEASETLAVVIERWPSKRTVIHPHRFPTDADIAARTFAAAAVRLAAIKRERRIIGPTDREAIGHRT
jgi:hypothetical protein